MSRVVVQGLLLNAIAVAGVVALALVTKLASLGGVSGREVLMAGAVAVAGAELAVLPLLLVRGATQAPVAQAGLVCTMVHLFVCLGAGAGVYLTGTTGVGGRFLFWLMGLYWLTLATLSTTIIRAVRRAPHEPPAAKA
ncbi:MAG: hypothetical protein ACREIT_04590 [Tepidisphaeraceae bacterium]